MKQIDINGEFEEKLRRITNHFGIDTQLIKLNEEMGELLNEGYRNVYKADAKEQLEDETADVLNVLIQVMLYFDLDWSRIGEVMNKKVNRCLDRIDNTDYYSTHTR